MANLTRYKQKIFANNSDQVGVFGTGVNKETSKNVETLQSNDYEGGWSEAIVTNKNYPIWQEMDGVQYGFSYQLAYLLQKGMPEWLSTETYYTNDFCKLGSIIYYSLQDNNTGHNPAANDGYWSPLLTSSRSIGQIVTSIVPLTESGLHLLDGSLIQGTGIYANFVTYMANLMATAPDIFITEADWQQSVTDYGVCGKFVYDSVNNTVRLPKVTGILEGTNVTADIGDLIEQFVKLPNITGSVAHTYQFGQADGSNPMPTTTGCLRFTKSDLLGSSQNYGHSYAFDIDASRSSSVYSGDGTDTTIQPQAVKVFYYIVVATSTKTDIEVDIDEIATDLNNKADTDLVNVTDTGNIAMANASMPSATYDDLTLGASGTTYTAPADGWFYFSGRPTQNGGGLDLINATNGFANNMKTVANAYVGIFLPVKKNDVVTVNYSALASPGGTLRFYYAKGAESEA